MIRTYQYRLFTNSSQHKKLYEQLSTHRELYNLAVRRGRQRGFKFWRQKMMWLDKIREDERYKSIDYLSAKNTISRFSKSLSPHIKGENEFCSFACQYKFTFNKLDISGVGEIRIKLHRPLPPTKVYQANIVYRANKWYVNFIIEVPKRSSYGHGAIGIDLGIRNFITTSDGKFYGKVSKLPKKQLSLEKIRNQRKDMHHKLARKLVDRYNCIVIEKLDIKNMKSSCPEIKNMIGGASWGDFIQILKEKANEYGVHIIEVNPRGTSQICSGCGRKVNKLLDESFHKCKCGVTLDRDVNAAKNILARAEPKLKSLKFARK